MPHRVGKSVTQEEIAEAIGVSRVWYAMLEAGLGRASARLLDRIAAAFMLRSEDRLRLLSLTYPELTMSGERFES